MSSIVIACNNLPGVELYRFFESCADVVKQTCHDEGFSYSLLMPPYLDNNSLVDKMTNHEICFIASHGDCTGIINEKEEYIIGTQTVNYAFDKKTFYAAACFSGLNLKEELLRIGVRLFVGYGAELRVGSDEELFVTTTISGMIGIIKGADYREVKAIMLKSYDEAIKKAYDNSKANPAILDDILLVHNRENLVVELGAESVCS